MNIKRITELFSQQATANTKRAQESNAEEEARRKQVEAVANGQDRVSISTRARQFQQISGIINEDELQRQARVSALKEQIQNGTYSVASSDVAQSILAFAKDNV